MPQVQLPFFPAGCVEINRDLGCRTEGEKVVYFNGHLPVFTHAKTDLASFRLFTSQLIVQGSATQGQIAKAFGVPLMTIKRMTKLFRERGSEGFFVASPRREGSQLNAEKLEQARGLILQGHSLREISEQTGVLVDTLRKAIKAGRLPVSKKKEIPQPESNGSAGSELTEALKSVRLEARRVSSEVVGPTTSSQRSFEATQAPMGYATNRTLDRVLSASGLMSSANLEFVEADDVTNGGVLFALPSLLEEGLLRHTREHYALPPGYYPMETLFLVLALLALVRCPSMEQVRYEAPGEWGKLLGLDRLPEVKTLREKIALLCEEPGQAAKWQSQLAKEWMSGSEVEDQALAGLYYADGHARVYHGGLTQLPRRYVARQKLCLRGTTDYWVNGLGGEPFFVITQVVNPGLVRVLRESIVPRLLADAPQPPAEMLEMNPRAVRFTVVVDREGYSPSLFAELNTKQIAILTYRKNPGELWPEDEFVCQTARLHTGEQIELAVAERGVRLSNGLWVREARELNGDGSQSSIVTTHWELDLVKVVVAIRARWSQENYLKYMKEHFGLDRLIEHGTTPLPETTVVINPAHRRLEQQVRRERAVLTRLRAQFGAHVLPKEPTAAQVQVFEVLGGELREKIQGQEAAMAKLVEQRKETPRKVMLKELPEQERFAQLRPESKHFIDTVKMIAYRAESAMAGELTEHLARPDDRRALLRRLYTTPVNLRPDPREKTLTVELHRMGSPLQDAAIAELCKTLTETETLFPTTSLRLIYRQVGSV